MRKWLAEPGLGEIWKIQTLLKSTKEKNTESHDGQRVEETRRIQDR